MKGDSTFVLVSIPQCERVERRKSEVGRIGWSRTPRGFLGE